MELLAKILFFVPLAFSATFLILYLTNINLQTRPNKKLIVVFMILSLINLSGIINFMKDVHLMSVLGYPVIYGLAISIIPSYFIYFSSVINPRPARRIPDYVHYLPALVLILSICIIYVLVPSEEFTMMHRQFRTSVISNPIYHRVLRFLLDLSFPIYYLQFAVYYTIIIILLAGKKRHEGMKFRSGFRFILIFIIMLMVLDLVGLYVELTYSGTVYKHLYSEVVNTAIIIAFGLFSFKLSNPYARDVAIEIEPEKFYGHETLRQFKARKKDHADPLTPEQKTRICDSFIDLIEAEQLYLDPDLRIQEVARLLKTNKYYLSIAIREVKHQTFNEIINAFRVARVRELLLDPDNQQYTLDAISKMAGFKSRQTFVTAFKKCTGQTPREFRMQNI